MSPPSRLLRLSDRVYHILLAAYPPGFRRRYGPEMAQVFRTGCRAAYDAAGRQGVLHLWLPTLGDWAWSASGEWLSGLFGRSMVKDIRLWRTSNGLISMLFFLSACLICLFLNPCSRIVSNEFLFGTPYCGLRIQNQSGASLSLTPIIVDGDRYSVARLYQKTGLYLAAYRQRDITVEAGQQVFWSYDCSKQVVSALYACVPDGDCYVNQKSYYIEQYTESGQYLGFTFLSLASLPRPEAALEAAVRSIPEHNYSFLKTGLLCALIIVALIGGVFVLILTRAGRIPSEL